MSSWNPAPSTVPGGWGTAPTDAWRNWKPERPKAPGRKPIILKRPDATLLEDYGPKKFLNSRMGRYLIYFLWIS